jgi:hypothetical protein
MLPSLKSRSSTLLAAIQEQFPNYHPLIAIAQIAHSDMADLELQFQCHKTIAKYIEPELKAVEVKSDANDHSVIRVSLFEDVSDAEIISETPQISNW